MEELIEAFTSFSKGLELLRGIPDREDVGSDCSSNGLRLLTA